MHEGRFLDDGRLSADDDALEFVYMNILVRALKQKIHSHTEY